MKIYFRNKNGLRLCGVLIKSAIKTDKCVILCHGLGVDKNEDQNIFVRLAKELAQKGLPVFRFDFMAHGESQGKPEDLTILREKIDLEAAVKLLKKMGYKEFDILGASLGGGAVCLFSAANENIIRALVLWNALIDYHSVLEPTLPWPKANFGTAAMNRLSKFGYTTVGGVKLGKRFFSEIKRLHPGKMASRTKTPTLFIHGTRDSYIPYQDSIEYSKLFKNAKLKLIEGAEHGLNDNKKHTIEAIKLTVDFLSKYLT